VDTANWVYNALTNQAQVVQTYPPSTHTHTHTHTHTCNTLYFKQGLLLVLAPKLPLLSNGDRVSGKDLYLEGTRDQLFHLMADKRHDRFTSKPSPTSKHNMLWQHR